MACHFKQTIILYIHILIQLFKTFLRPSLRLTNAFYAVLSLFSEFNAITTAKYGNLLLCFLFSTFFVLPPSVKEYVFLNNLTVPTWYFLFFLV